jgi:uracil-DNA glycosylase
VNEAGPIVTTLAALAGEEQSCRRCPLYMNATQAVPGEGRMGAPLMLVGEQPGDSEDREGRPFVGPAGRVLEHALKKAGVERGDTFMTNAVKHFKFEERGKRRLHKRPDAREIERCQWWLNLERQIVRPKLIVALGATALRGLLGRAATITSLRGKPQTLADGTPLIATIHPSFLLRLPEEAAKQREFNRFVADLVTARDLLKTQQS